MPLYFSVLFQHFFTSIKTTSSYLPEEISRELLIRKYESLNVDSDLIPGVRPSPVDKREYLLISNQGFILNFLGDRNRKSALKLFWKFQTLHEFVNIKKIIYQDYSDYLRSEIVNLKEYHLSIKSKFLKEDPLRLSPFNSEIPYFLWVLDKHIQSASPYYRKIYSFISKGTEFDDIRLKLNELINVWEEEIEKWEPSLLVLWTKLIAPIRSIFIK